MSPLAPAVVVFEKSPCWESELKRRLVDRRVLVRPCRSRSDVISLCAQMPGSVVIVDFAAGAADCLRLLEALLLARLGTLPIVIATRASIDLEWPARELGAVAFVTDLVGGDRLAEMCQRMLPPC